MHTYCDNGISKRFQVRYDRLNGLMNFSLIFSLKKFFVFIVFFTFFFKQNVLLLIMTTNGQVELYRAHVHMNATWWLRKKKQITLTTMSLRLIVIFVSHQCFELIFFSRKKIIIFIFTLCLDFFLARINTTFMTTRRWCIFSSSTVRI